MVREMLRYIGEDPLRPGLEGTPERVVKAWGEVFSGYRQDPSELFTIFDLKGCDELVLLKDIEFVSHCEHHLMAFSGKAHIGYIPKKGRVVGVSKLARLLECFSRRLQIQERIGMQVTEAMMEYLEPLGCGCVLEARHSCISCRGVGKQNSSMVTSSMRGVFRKTDVRHEFFRMIGL
jgi:GTP cyclohydrolase I